MQKNKEIQELLFDIYEKPTRELDNYLEDIREQLLGKNITTSQLEDFIITIPLHLYWLITETEELGIQEDFAKLQKNEVYNKALSIAQGKVDEKRALAENESQTQAIIHMAYSRAYKLMKGKIEMAQELLNSCKKILTLRITDTELSNNKYSGRSKE